MTVLGIDLGTSYSSAGAMIDGRLELVRDDGDAMIPSVVHLPARGTPSIGHRAVAYAATDPASTVTSVKRLLGLGDPALLAANLPYPVKSVNGRVVLQAGGRDYAVEQIAVLILTRCASSPSAASAGRSRAPCSRSPQARASCTSLRCAAPRLAHLQRCEAAKRALSTARVARVLIREGYIERGAYRDLDFALTRELVEPLWQPLIDRAIDRVQAAPAAARWAPAEVDRVILIGGGAMVPLFRAAMARALPADRITSTPLAGVAVAMGATVLAGTLAPPVPTAVLRGLEAATDDSSIQIEFD